MARGRHPGWALAGLFVLLTIPLGVWTAGRRAEAERRAAELATGVPQATRTGYATSDTCEACHPSQHHSWHRGYHRTMTQYASPASVRGDFDDVRLAGDGYDVRLFRRGDDFMVDMVNPVWQFQVDGRRIPPPAPGQAPPRVERRISLVTGSHHMQAYWVPSHLADDNAQFSLPFTYLLNDRRWVPRGDVFLRSPDERHPEQAWNVGCITCHSTAGQPRAGASDRGTRTQVAEIGIACEACHGPAERHVAANHDPLRRYALHLRGEGDPTIVNPARLPAVRASQVCGQCHALTDLGDDIYLGAGKTYVAGDDLEASQPLLRPLHPTPALARQIASDPEDYLRNYFWADGTIRVSSRDYSGMIESRCMDGGALGCGTCHSLHESDPDDLLADGMAGDKACVACHAPIAADIAAHTHHRGDSVGSRCYNCHMPHTVYGLLKGIRNHRIDSPKVTGRSGGSERPNACNLCHVDRSLGWTAAALERWYGQPAPAGLAADDTPAAVEWLLAGDAVLRAIAAWQFGWPAARATAPVDKAVPYLVAALADPYAAVRYVAGHSLAAINPANDFDYLASPDERQRAAERILDRWLAKAPGNARDTARIQQLIDRRDDTPVRAME